MTFREQEKESKPSDKVSSSSVFYERDLSWLSFNERVLAEASRASVPLMERIRFLAIFSSNLDEFYRVRIPALIALHDLYKKDKVAYEKERRYPDVLRKAHKVIQVQQEVFGKILSQQIIPALQAHNINLLYNEPIPAELLQETKAYFFSEVLAFLQVVDISDENEHFFPENNKLYFMLVTDDEEGQEVCRVVNIPSDQLPRFFSIEREGRLHIVFLDDIVKEHLGAVLRDKKIKGYYSFKITRNAEYNIEDEYEGDIGEKIEKQIEKRDFGSATRLLHQPGLPAACLKTMEKKFGLKKAIITEGGRYHNLKDFLSLPVKDPALSYEKWPVGKDRSFGEDGLLLDLMNEKDRIVHTPYQSYDTVLRFFNEAALEPSVTEIFTTLYRVADNSRIVNALISASKNGKRVAVFVELKARFDEANNLKWSKKMKAAGIRIIYSIPELKVHAKIALVKRRDSARIRYAGLLATGNMNESTARFYTDHILLTTHQEMLGEMENLFHFLTRRKRPETAGMVTFNHLLVAQFNLQQCFLDLIDREISNKKNNLPAGIIIKLNNLEEHVLIRKLYEASQAGVPVQLIVRGICCLIPGLPGVSENITVKRIVDRYLEHGRVFIFHNVGNARMYMGSADWMNRNIYSRIEVCFPIYDPAIRQEVLDMIRIQLDDTTDGISIFGQPEENGAVVRSQKMISEMLAGKELRIKNEE